MKKKSYKLMTAGPVEIEPDVRAAGARQMIYNRTAEFSILVKKIGFGLQYFFQTKCPVYIFACSGTGAMEAAVANTFSKGDKVVVIARGKFGLLWEEIAKSYGLKVSLLKLTGEQQVTAEQFKAALNPDVKGVFANANETSTGIKTDIAALGRLVKHTKAVLVVDAISSIGADEFKTDAWHCDMVIASSQKALALPPGLAFISVSAKARRLMETSDLPKFYFDLKKYEANFQRGQTPFTPAISLLYQLDQRLKKIKRRGLIKQLKEFARSAAIIRKALSRQGLQPVTGHYAANGMVTVRLPDGVVAAEVVKRLKSKNHIQLAPNPPGPAGQFLRIGLMGNITRHDIKKFLGVLGTCLKECGYNFK